LPAQLTLNVGDAVANLVIQMAEQGVITGRVIDVNGNAVVNGLVTLQQTRYANGMRQMVSGAAQTTDDRGVYRFANVSPGRYYVVASDQANRREENDRNIPSGTLANIRTYYPSADGVEVAKAVAVAAGMPPGEYYIAAFPGVDQTLLESHEFVTRFNSDSTRIELSEGARIKLDAPILSTERIALEVAKLP
jgi:hypothetical protein